MNNYILILKGDNKELGIFEFKTLYEIFYNKKIKLYVLSNTIYSLSTEYKLENNVEFISRLTYTNAILKQFFIAEDTEDYKSKILNLNFDELNKNNKKFVLRNIKSKKKIKTPFSEIELAKPIWDKLENPQINLENPQITFNCIFIDDSKKFIFAIKVFENKKKYLNRMPIMRPIKMPYTLKSDMARCAINLLGLKSGIILDPFCGIGGILLEAKDMNFDIIGNDISYNDLKYFKINLDYFYPNSDYIRILADAQTQFLQNNSIDGIVTDIPYGRCSRKLGKNLYERFLQNAKQILKPNSRMVIIYANFTEFKEIAEKYFDEICEIKEYINKSMTRYILVLKNNK